MQGILGDMQRAEELARQRDASHGMIRPEPSAMQRIGSVMADYAVPDFYERLLGNISDGANVTHFSPSVSMQDILRYVRPRLMDMRVPHAGCCWWPDDIRWHWK